MVIWPRVDTGGRNLIVIFVSNLVASMGMSGFLPAFPIILPKLGIHDPAGVGIWTGVLTAAAPFSAAISGPIWGAMGDRIGRKFMVVRALVGLTVFMGLMSFVSDPWILLLLRIGQGCFSGFIAPSLTLVSIHMPATRQGFVASVLQTALLLGGVVGPPIGGLILDHGTPSHIFATAAAAGLFSTVVVILFAREEVSAAIRSHRGGALSAAANALGDVRKTLREATVVKLLIALFLVRFGVSVVEPLFAFYVKTFESGSAFIANNLGFANGALVAAAPLGNLLALPFWGRAGDRTGYGRVFTLAAGGAALFFAPQALAPEPISLFIIRFAAGVALAGVIPAAYGLVACETSVERRGAAYSLTFSSIALANSIAPVTGGLLLSTGLSVRPLLILASVPMLAAAVWASRWPAKSPIPDPL